MSSRISESRTGRLIVLAGALAVLILSSGCDIFDDDDDDRRAAAPQSFQGTIFGAGAGESGVVEGTIADATLSASFGPSSTVQVAGTLTILAPSSGVFTVTGTYDTQTRELDLTADGYTLTATLNASRNEFVGTYQGPNGTGSFVSTDCMESAVLYCGTFEGNEGSCGVWNLVRCDDSLIGGFANACFPNTGILRGTVSGNVLSITYDSGTAGGTIDGSSVSGTWDDDDGESGVWSGSAGACGKGA